MSDKQKNVLGQDLEQCSLDPLTGWYRDGCCNTDENDHGVHTVCAKVTDEFLEWCKEAGNDLITPHPEFGFPGLKNGDGWCVCASWYAKAVEAGKGCPIYLKSTHQNTLKILPIEILKKLLKRKKLTTLVDLEKLFGIREKHVDLPKKLPKLELMMIKTLFGLRSI